MAGVKGKSGGARPGAGRPLGSRNKPVLLDIAATDDPRAFLVAVMNHAQAPMAMRVQVARALLQAGHAEGKKAAATQAANKVSSGRFEASAPPL